MPYDALSHERARRAPLRYLSNLEPASVSCSFEVDDVAPVEASQVRSAVILEFQYFIVEARIAALKSGDTAYLNYLVEYYYAQLLWIRFLQRNDHELSVKESICDKSIHDEAVAFASEDLAVRLDVV